MIKRISIILSMLLLCSCSPVVVYTSFNNAKFNQYFALSSYYPPRAPIGNTVTRKIDLPLNDFVTAMSSVLNKDYYKLVNITKEENKTIISFSIYKENAKGWSCGAFDNKGIAAFIKSKNLSITINASPSDHNKTLITISSNVKATDASDVLVDIPYNSKFAIQPTIKAHIQGASATAATSAGDL